MTSNARVREAAKAVNMVATLVEGEWRITYRLSVICAVYPNLSDAALLRKAEALASYTDDNDDAVGTVEAMAFGGVK